MKKNILVTGAGAVLGQGILRCLVNHKEDYYIHTADPDYLASGHWLGNKAHLIKMANDPNYITCIEKIIKEENIDIVLIGTDTELPLLSLNKSNLESKYDVIVIVSNIDVINIANDKYLTSNFLKNNCFPYPLSYMSSDLEGVQILKKLSQYPYIAKPIDGARSKGLQFIESESDFDRVTSYKNNLVIQEYISDKDGEYTSGCLVFDKKCVSIVTLKRDLKDGNTSKAYYYKEFDKFNSFISNFAEILGVEGPCNFQFRIKNGIPIIFEINARFSGTTPLRYFFGFNEVVACIDFYLYKKSVINNIDLNEGIIIRSFSDIFISKSEVEKFKSNNFLINPDSTYYPFK